MPSNSIRGFFKCAPKTFNVLTVKASVTVPTYLYFFILKHRADRIYCRVHNLCVIFTRFSDRLASSPVSFPVCAGIDSSLAQPISGYSRWIHIDLICQQTPVKHVCICLFKINCLYSKYLDWENKSNTHIRMSWPFNAFISDILSRIHSFFFILFRSNKKNGRLNITGQKAF